MMSGAKGGVSGFLIFLTRGEGGQEFADFFLTRG